MTSIDWHSTYTSIQDNIWPNVRFVIEVIIFTIERKYEQLSLCVLKVYSVLFSKFSNLVLNS